MVADFTFENLRTVNQRPQTLISSLYFDLLVKVHGEICYLNHDLTGMRQQETEGFVRRLAIKTVVYFDVS